MTYYIIRDVSLSGEPVFDKSVSLGRGYIPVTYKDSIVFVKSREILDNNTIFSTMTGRYMWKKDLKERDLFNHTHLKSPGLYNYSFEREYEAVNHFDIFQGKEEIVNNIGFIGSDCLKYTFGIEYETAVGMIPENICFRDGLIPLRDGSISGVEYSTTILKSNDGVNLVKQQCETLKKYTDFNKECALHIHFGGYPVRGIFLFSLYSLLYTIQSTLTNYTNEYVFNTRKYKRNGKDYCKSLPRFSNFNHMYETFVGDKFKNSLRKPHPADVDHNHKWQIGARYYWVNFINMMCYESPKTVEFRFLRPSYNFSKIYTWILVLNGLLMCAENMTRKYGVVNPDKCYELYNGDIKACLKSVYSGETFNIINAAIEQIYIAEQNKKYLEDYSGSKTYIDDKIINVDYECK